MRGFTTYICFGRYGGFRMGKDGPSYRIVLGYVSIAFCLIDLERCLQLLLLNQKEFHRDQP